MSISINGTSLVWDGTCTISNFTDASTGVVTLTLTPSGGVGNLPALVDGTPGLPPTLRNLTVNQVAFGVTPPASSWTQFAAGGPGTASVYDATVYVNSGQRGLAGTNGAFLGSSDLSGTATVGYVPAYTTVPSAGVVWSPQKCGPTYNAFPISNVSNSGTNSQSTLCSVSVPAQPFAWYPWCCGQAVTSGTANTVIGLKAMLNSATTGNVVGQGLAVAGNVNQVADLGPGFGAAIGGGYGQVAANASAQIYFVAVQTASTSDAWSIAGAAAGNAWFTVQVQPVP